MAEEVYEVEQFTRRTSCLSEGVYNLICGLNLEYTRNSQREKEKVIQLLAGKRVTGNHKEKIQLLDTVAKLSLAKNSDGSLNFANTVKQLIPFVHYVHKQLMQLTVEEFEGNFGMDLDWTDCKHRIVECFKLLKKSNEEPVNVILSSLLLFAILERSLGDVYASYTGLKSPSNLKDLLASEAIRKLLGEDVSLILYAMAGPPESINLRNVLWHGFVSPCEIPPQFVSFLVFTMATISSRFAAIKIERRPQIKLTQLDRLCIFPNIESIKCISAIQDYLFTSSLFIAPSMLPIWKKALQCYEEQRYDLVLIVLLPLLEHALRMVFAHANNCPKRILTAESTTLYTTFDEILAPSLPGGTENQLRTEIGDEFLQMLLDILVYTDGPRLRDRISHGEVDLDCIPSDLSNHVLCICVVFATHFASELMENLSIKVNTNITDKYTETTGKSLSIEATTDSTQENFLCSRKLETTVTEGENIQNCSNMELSSNSDIIRQIVLKARSYQSVFHPIAMLKSEVKDLTNAIDGWVHIPLPETEFEMTSVSELFEAQEKTLKIIRFIFYHGQELILNGIVMDTCDLEMLLDDGQFSRVISLLCDKIQVPMLYRPKKELEVVSLLSNIVHHCSILSSQVLNTANQRYQQWSKKELRSRQRANYKRLLSLLPLFKNVIKVVLAFILIELPSLQANSDKTRARYVKFLKRCLQSTENLESLSGPSKNKWDECRIVGEQLMNIIQSHFT
ncbi:endoplasmic reticulum membrane-associated RNA degradation protein-like isoform X1 [Actinia tenebrosa]|uniref:Endoplasmic reticulum membrane-associated RNA degradation protein-like isoform X1 n=1 Tax=Actinia tenebrosa TaxID=6105 RepID=A0A6P8IBV2_ACTTE|nr:endoplasmic reticulum membrane-associated RNA degradation protein-like isoform X1 [Actinia tenebrosa]